MAEEIILEQELSKDYLNKNQDDQEIICSLSVRPSDEYRKQVKEVYCSIILVLDSSYSMNDSFGENSNITRREGVIQAASKLTEHLHPKDTVSVIFFDNSAHRICSAILGSETQKIQSEIEKLRQFTGATNFEAAMNSIQAELSNVPHNTQRIIFLTDGNATTGNTDRAKEIVKELANQGATLDCLGVGNDFNLAFMRELSAHSNGLTELLATPDDADESFKQLLKSAQRSIASSVFLTCRFNSKVRDLEAFQLTPEMRYFGKISSGESLEVNLQTIDRNRSNTIIIRGFIDPPKDEEYSELIHARLDYDLPPLQKKNEVLENRTIIHFSNTDGELETNTDIIEYYQEACLSKLEIEFRKHADNDWKKANEVLVQMLKITTDFDLDEKKNAYQQLQKNLQTKHKLSNSDLNTLVSVSSVSTMVKRGEIQEDYSDLF
jgi:Ca-activated chloride channel family protein